MRKMILLCLTVTGVALMLSTTSGKTHSKDDDWRPGASPRRSSKSTARSPDGCPIESRDGLSLYIASMRPGTRAATTSGRPTARARTRPSASR